MNNEKSKGTYNKAQRNRRLERQVCFQLWLDKEDMQIIRDAAKSKDIQIAQFFRNAVLKSAKNRLRRVSV